MTEDVKKKAMEQMPTASSIREEYQKQGRNRSDGEANQIMDQIRGDMEAGHLDAMENLIMDETLENVAGGAITPTKTGAGILEARQAEEDRMKNSYLEVIVRPN